MHSLPVLVLNSGSSSIKFSVYEAADGERARLFEGAVDGIGTSHGQFWIKDSTGRKLLDQTLAVPNRSVAFNLVADALHSGEFPEPSAIGHRTVCCGPTVRENQLITPELIDEIDKYAALAPLHTPIGVYIMREALRLFPGVPNFAVLDTYFHRTMPEVVASLPLPDEYAAMGVRRYGFHGISYESIVCQLQPNVPENLIVAHLGNGASISAIRNGECLDTSMSMTPVSGIISGTRTGDIDPGVILFILRKIAEKTASAMEAADQLDAVIRKRAGLLGLSGLSNDMRTLRRAIEDGNPKARLAVDKFTWTIARWIGSFVAELGGLDMLVFTGGIGENDIATRAEVCAGLGVLGIVLDPRRNNVRGQAVISADHSPVTVCIIPPAEDLIIVNHVIRLLAKEEAIGGNAEACCVSALHRDFDREWGRLFPQGREGTEKFLSEPSGSM
jgi:acetate kinase